MKTGELTIGGIRRFMGAVLHMRVHAILCNIQYLNMRIYFLEGYYDIGRWDDGKWITSCSSVCTWGHLDIELVIRPY